MKVFGRRSLIRPCPECHVDVIWPNNDTLLDFPEEPFDEVAGVKWTVERVVNFPGFKNRTRILAMTGRPPVIRNNVRVAHRLHEHQPETSLARRGRNPWEVDIRV